MAIYAPSEAAAPVEVFGKDPAHPGLSPLTSEELIARLCGAMSAEEADRLEAAIGEMCEKIDEAPGAA